MAEQNGEYRGEWIPKADFYLSNARSKEIRSICGAAVDAIGKLLHDRSVATDPTKRATLYADLEKINGELLNLGIQSNIHVGQPLEAFKSSPVTSAEFLAGQLFPLLGKKIPSESEVMPIIQEFSIEKSGGANVLESGNVPEKVRDFQIARSLVEMVKDAFDMNTQTEDKDDNR